MKKVTDKIIDGCIDASESMSEEKMEKLMEAFSEEQPMLFSYIFSEENGPISEEEHSFLEYLAMIIWMAYKKVQPEAHDKISEEEIGDAEEANFEVIENSKAKDFSGKIDSFFEGYEQEELLAFVEEALTEDDFEGDAIISQEAIEPMFVSLKTMIDVLSKTAK
jgi:hypothetical protein